MKPVSIEQLINSLHPGERVFVSGSAGEATAVTTTIEGHPALARGVKFLCSFIPGVNRCNLADHAERQMAVYFMQPHYEGGAQDGHIAFSPLTYSQILQSYQANGKPDTLLLQVAPPDAQGRCSLGPQGEFLPALLNKKLRLVAVINPNVPALTHAPWIHIDELELVTESDDALRTYDAGQPNQVAAEIAAHIANLLPDGATLQCGLGKIPSQLMAALSHHRGLRIHSGMVSDSLLPLLEQGTLDPDSPIVSTVALGSANLYQRLAEIPQLHIRGVDYTHDAGVLAQAPKLHTVNSALEVDLLGQANAEVLNGRYVSGPGGLPDFAAAARRQLDGLSIIALPATDPSGKHSRIVAQLGQGSPVTVPQYHVDAIVTEFGIALLRDSDLQRRAAGIIDIAHPDHREALAEALHRGRH